MLCILLKKVDINNKKVNKNEREKEVLSLLIVVKQLNALSFLNGN